MDLREADDAIAYAEMDAIVKAGGPWVGFCYSPHYAFALQNLVRLDEPAYNEAMWKVAQPDQDPDWLNNSDAAVAWPPLSIHVAYATALKNDFPAMAAMLENVQLTTAQLSEMTFALVVEKRDADEYAREWIAKNEVSVLRWFAN